MAFKYVNVPRKNTGEGCLSLVTCHHMMFKKQGCKTTFAHSMGRCGPEVTRFWGNRDRSSFPFRAPENEVVSFYDYNVKNGARSTAELSTYSTEIGGYLH